jgi:hypothetical protein
MTSPPNTYPAVIFPLKNPPSRKSKASIPSFTPQATTSTFVGGFATLDSRSGFQELPLSGTTGVPLPGNISNNKWDTAMLKPSSLKNILIAFPRAGSAGKAASIGASLSVSNPATLSTLAQLEKLPTNR